ncbi:MAG: hypothetical protein GY729_13280 [Desulfobacteraceae bacterium]|nr:hypothetical protein [Desulfobacteraceae bacterium]
MSQNFNTLELARIYESQGYIKDAFEMYQTLNKTSDTNEIRSAVKRLGKRIFQYNEKNSVASRVSERFKDYLELLILEKKIVAMTQFQNDKKCSKKTS